MNELGLYIHIPFCKSKCNYCDFTSFANKEELVQKYVECLTEEIRQKARKDELIETIYIGGGTPSYIEPKYIEKILATIEANFNIDENVEISIEVNPGTATIEKIEEYYQLGINRLSIGIQSTNDDILKKIGRIHTYKQFLDTIEIAKKVGFTNINADIMIGLPGQTIYDVEDTIDKLLKLELPHISVYSLIVEPNTKIEKMLEDGKISLPDEEIERYMYWFAKRKLEGSGYIHYEISNFAKPSFRCQHNIDCWNQKEYLGFGLAAASYENGIRYKNIDCLQKYIKNIEENESYKNIRIDEKQDKISQMNEYMLLGLRMIKGIKISKFKSKFSENPYEIYRKQLDKLLQEELIEIDTDNIRLSKKGLDLANIVWEEFI